MRIGLLHLFGGNGHLDGRAKYLDVEADRGVRPLSPDVALHAAHGAELYPDVVALLEKADATKSMTDIRRVSLFKEGDYDFVACSTCLSWWIIWRGCVTNIVWTRRLVLSIPTRSSGDSRANT